MHYCNKCLGTIPNHLPDQKVCSRCVAEDERGKENKRLRDVLNEIYPVVAGMVISSQKRLEKEAEEHWNQYCHMILNALKGRRE